MLKNALYFLTTAFIVNQHIPTHGLVQGRPTRGPRAIFGPPRHFEFFQDFHYKL
jgi:hypothetical protein